MTIVTVIVYLTGLLFATYLLVAWFNSTLPVHFFHVLRRLGWKKHDPFWEQVPEWATTTDDFIDSLVLCSRVHPFISSLAGCKYCLSIHLAFWVSVAAYTATLCLGYDLSILFIPVAAGSWPILMLVIFRHA